MVLNDEFLESSSLESDENCVSGVWCLDGGNGWDFNALFGDGSGSVG